MTQVYISARTAAKIAGRHGITRREIEEALLGVPDLTGQWDNDPRRGIRAQVQVVIRGRRTAVILYPRGHTGDDDWDLGSAYFS